MTIKEAQELVAAWEGKLPSRHRSELTNMAALTEEVGELVRVIARKHGELNPTSELLRREMANELGDVFWVLLSISEQAGVDLAEALIDGLEKKNQPDSSGRRDRNRR